LVGWGTGVLVGCGTGVLLGWGTGVFVGCGTDVEVGAIVPPDDVGLGVRVAVTPDPPVPPPPSPPEVFPPCVGLGFDPNLLPTGIVPVGVAVGEPVGRTNSTGWSPWSLMEGAMACIVA